jgi:hypothetical protein
LYASALVIISDDKIINADGNWQASTWPVVNSVGENWQASTWPVVNSVGGNNWQASTWPVVDSLTFLSGLKFLDSFVTIFGLFWASIWPVVAVGDDWQASTV